MVVSNKLEKSVLAKHHSYGLIFAQQIEIFRKKPKRIDILRKEMYNLRKEQYTNCKAIGDECSEEL